jgi:hypothetical protein
MHEKNVVVCMKMMMHTLAIDRCQGQSVYDAISRMPSKLGVRRVVLIQLLTQFRHSSSSSTSSVVIMPIVRLVRQEEAETHSGRAGCVFLHGDSRFPKNASKRSIDTILDMLLQAGSGYELKGVSAVSHNETLRTEYVFYGSAVLSSNQVQALAGIAVTTA